MENGIEKAIEQMRQKDEAGLNYIYSKTYNFVYLRSKSILRNEEDVKQLMQNVYLQAYVSTDGLQKANLYEWLGKRTYLLGCQYYKKRKEREIPFLEMEQNELNPRKVENTDKSIEIICGILDELPDLYQATLFAFYYDYLKIDEIAEVMGCSPDIIKNRLNYVRKYIKKAMENYMEEQGENPQIKVAFSIEVLCAALRKWSVDHCLGITTAQSVYAAICREAELKAGTVRLEGKEFAGVNNTVIYHKQDDFEAIEEEILLHTKKRAAVVLEQRNLPYIAGIGIIALVIILAVVFLCNKPEKKKHEGKKPAVTQEKDVKKDQAKEKNQTEEQEPVVDEPKSQEEESGQQAESEYIFAKSNTEALTREEVQGHTKEELRLARNEIYARHGVVFGVEDLDAYFRTKSWYNPTISLSDFLDTVQMSMIEEENITLIQEVESSM